MHAFFGIKAALNECSSRVHFIEVGIDRKPIYEICEYHLRNKTNYRELRSIEDLFKGD